MICRYESLAEYYGVRRDFPYDRKVLIYEIEPEDREEIVEALYEVLIDFGLARNETIRLYCPLTDEDVEVEVDVLDYIDDLKRMVDADDGLDDEIKIELINELLELEE